MALRPVDRLLTGYIAFSTMCFLARGLTGTVAWILLSYALLGVLLYLFNRHEEKGTIGRLAHTLYPLFLLLPLYTAIGLVNGQVGLERILQHDAIVQSWEQAIFGGQPSFDLIRAYPSVAVSGILHLAYFCYYPIVTVGPPIVLLRGSETGARRIILATMLAFVACYVVFILFPVAGPNYAFETPTGPVTEVWPARLVYIALGNGSAVGTAFPSSHVAAATAATVGALCAWKRLGQAMLLPCILLILGTVYAQMHYVIDATAGLIVGLAAGIVATRLEP